MLWDDMHDTVWAHTHACVHMNPSHRVEVASTTTRHEPVSLCVGSVRFWTHAPHQCCEMVFNHACTHHLRTYACSDCLRMVHSLAWLSVTSLYIHGSAWTYMITLTNNKLQDHIVANKGMQESTKCINQKSLIDQEPKRHRRYDGTHINIASYMTNSDSENNRTWQDQR